MFDIKVHNDSRIADIFVYPCVYLLHIHHICLYIYDTPYIWNTYIVNISENLKIRVVLFTNNKGILETATHIDTIYFSTR